MGIKSKFDGKALGWTVRVDLTPEQEQIAWRNIGAQRFAYNWAVEKIKGNYGADTPRDARIWSAFSLRSWWYEDRGRVAPWWAENSKEAYSSGIAQAVRALQNFQDGRDKKRTDKPRFPRRKRKFRAAATFSASTGVALRSAREIKIPVVGRVRSYERLRRLWRAQERGDLLITGMTLRHKNGKWYVSIKHRIAEVVRYRHDKFADPDSVVGVDLGQGRMLATVASANGFVVGVIDRPDGLRRAYNATRAAGRRTRRRVKGSARWRAAMADRRKAHEREANIRKDLIHKSTSQVAKTHGVPVLEDLAVKALSRGWSKTMGRAGLGEFRRQIEYKSEGALGADRFFPSSKRCSACGWIYADLRLSQDHWTCADCGADHQRDENAGTNLAQLGAAWMEGQTVPCGPLRQMKRKPRAKSVA